MKIRDFLEMSASMAWDAVSILVAMVLVVVFGAFLLSILGSTFRPVIRYWVDDWRMDNEREPDSPPSNPPNQGSGGSKPNNK